MRRLTALVLFASLALLSCETKEPSVTFPSRTPNSTPTSSDAFVVGLVGTLTGPDSWRGEDAFEGADLGVHDLNQQRGGAAFELVSLDDEGDPERSLELVRQLAESQRTIGVVYAGPPEAVRGAESALADAGIPALVCYGDLYAARELTAHTFQVGPSYLWEARRLAGYFVRDRRYRRIGALAPSGDAWDGALGSLETAMEEAGAELARTERFADESEVGAALDGLKEAKSEAVIVGGDQGDFQAVLQELRSRSGLYKSTSRARIATARSPRQTRRHARAWRPQIGAFDPAIGIGVESGVLVPGTVAADSYSRGAQTLPVPSLADFSKAFSAWWESEPLGWERRGYEAVRIIGWAHAAAEGKGDLAQVLETMRGERLGGLDVTFGPDDHTVVDAPSVGLWVVPTQDDIRTFSLSLPDELPWAPLARGFSIDGEDTEIPSKDWRYLFKNAPRPEAPPPKVTKMKFSVASPRRDPIH